MRSKTEAIIISSMNLGEADKLVTFFSLDRGMLKGVAKNARKSFRRFGAGLESFTLVRLHLYEREHQELLRIESADIIEQHAAIGGCLPGAAAGAVMLELVRELSPLGERNAQAFLLLSHVLHLLDEGEDPLFLLGIFEIKFLSLLGYQPKLDHCLSCGVQPRGEIVFLGMKGGILCPDCMVSSGDLAGALVRRRRGVLLPGAQDGHGQGLPPQTLGRHPAGARQRLCGAHLPHPRQAAQVNGVSENGLRH